MKWCIAGLLATLALCACGPKNEPAAEPVNLKNGKLVNPDAPRPSDESINEALNALL